MSQGIIYRTNLDCVGTERNLGVFGGLSGMEDLEYLGGIWDLDALECSESKEAGRPWRPVSLWRLHCAGAPLGLRAAVLYKIG